MKKHIITILFLAATACCTTSHAQDWIGTQFELDTAVILSPTNLDLGISNIRYEICDGVFYYTDIKGFQNSENGHTATIYSVSLYDYAQSEIKLSLPSGTRQKDFQANTFWINDFDIRDKKLAISVQNHILLYRQNENFQYEFDTMFDHPNIKATYLHQNVLYYLEEDHDTGYKWFRQTLRGGDETLIRELHYEAPHVVQANPNRYLFRDQHHLFFLSTRYPVLHQYSLDGQWEGDIEFDIPSWHPFENAYIEKTLSVPYGVERIYATMSDIFKYSYPKVVFPIGGAYLLYHTQYDSIVEKSHLQYALRDNSGKTIPFSIRRDDNEAYREGEFPFNLFQAQTDKAHISWNDLLIEISAEDTAHWTGLTPTAYKEIRDRFFKQNDPVFKLRIMRHKNTDWPASAFFIDTEARLHSLEDLPQGKHMLLVTNELECSACERQLLQFLNDSLNHDIRIGILHPYIPGALLEREISKRIKLHLERPFRLYYLAQSRRGTYPWETAEPLSYPALLLYETGRAPILFSLDQIFNDDPYNPSYRSEFLNTFHRFVTASPSAEDSKKVHSSDGCISK